MEKKKYMIGQASDMLELPSSTIDTEHPGKLTIRRITCQR